MTEIIVRYKIAMEMKCKCCQNYKRAENDEKIPRYTVFGKLPVTADEIIACPRYTQKELSQLKTTQDIYDEINIPCEFCSTFKLCVTRCVHPVRFAMYDISEEMVLRGEY